MPVEAEADRAEKAKAEEIAETEKAGARFDIRRRRLDAMEIESA